MWETFWWASEEDLVVDFGAGVVGKGVRMMMFVIADGVFVIADGVAYEADEGARSES